MANAREQNYCTRIKRREVTDRRINGCALRYNVSARGEKNTMLLSLYKVLVREKALTIALFLVVYCLLMIGLSVWLTAGNAHSLSHVNVLMNIH